jgi:hypothetical protein
MSHNTTVDLEIKDLNLLKKALIDALGLTEAEVEVHKTPVDIFDYYGAIPKPVHVVIRKQALRRVFGQGFADAGVFVENGVGKLHHDDMDTKLSRTYGKIKGQYARHTTLEAARKAGRKVEERIEGGRLILRVTK